MTKGGLALLLAAICALGLAGCRDTDFFSEVVISPFATDVDTGNQEKTIVNSPDATQESDQLSSLDWDSKAKKSDEVENLVTYSKKPNSTLNTHRSNYSINPRFKGIESSDPVQLEFGLDTDLKKKKSAARSAASTESSSKQSSKAGSKQTGKNSKSGASDAGKGKSNNGKGDTKGKKKKSGGLSGKVTVFDPNNALADPPKKDHVAAIGQAAVLVQAIGGQGALCAMDEQAYSGKHSSGAASFATVFASSLKKGFAKSSLLWKDDGTQPSDLQSVSKLVKACGKGGVVIYDQDAVNPNGSWFSKSQRQALQKAKITFVPVSFSSIAGMRDAATLVGKVLSKSAAAKSYCAAIDEVMSTAKAAQTSTANSVYTAVATDFVQGLSYSGNLLKTEGGLLFTRIDSEKLLSTWSSNVGVKLKGADEADAKTGTYDALWGIKYGANYKKSFFPKNAYTSSCNSSIQIASGNTTSSTSGNWPGKGLGSSEFPYLVVSASGKLSAENVRSAVVDEVCSYADGKTVTPYSALEGNKAGRDPNEVVSTIGSNGINDDNLLYGKRARARSCVRANPSGLLGSWTQGSVESVLETVWLGRIYSETPEGSGYEPVCKLSASDLKASVLKFYKDAYGYDASSVYSKLVTDEGGA